MEAGWYKWFAGQKKMVEEVVVPPTYGVTKLFFVGCTTCKSKATISLFSGEKERRTKTHERRKVLKRAGRVKKGIGEEVVWWTV